jgi:hypothetical protein
MNIYTYQISPKFKGLHGDILLVDTTVKSGVKAFAPTWPMVMAHKAGIYSDLTYEVLYRRRMRLSQELVPKAWDKLMALQDVAIGCYCTPGKFCHRHILVKIVGELGIEMGLEIKECGELKP